MSLKIRTAIFLFMLALPVLDALNGILSRQYGKSVGTIYHVLLTVVLVFAAMYGNKSIRKKYFLPLCTFAITLFIGITVAILSNRGNDIAIDLLMKQCCTIINFVSLCILIECKMIERNFCDKILKYTSIVIPIGMMFSYITGISNTAYIASGRGFLGFYSSSNELNCIVLILAYYCLSKYYATRNEKYIFLFFVQALCAIMIESKISMGMCLIAILLLIYIGINRMKRRITKAEFAIFLIILIGICFAPIILSNVFSSFMERQGELRNAYSNPSFINYFTSGRLERFNQVLNYSFRAISSKNVIQNMAYTLMVLLFGNGFCNYTQHRYFEMEYFDNFFWCGLVGELLLIWFTIKIMRKSYFTQNKKILLMISPIVAFICSFFSGHVLCGGVAGIYFALTCVNACKCNLKEFD